MPSRAKAVSLPFSSFRNAQISGAFSDPSLDLEKLLSGVGFSLSSWAGKMTSFKGINCFVATWPTKPVHSNASAIPITIASIDAVGGCLWFTALRLSAAGSRQRIGIAGEDPCAPHGMILLDGVRWRPRAPG
jgi:hypothetical protein